MEGQVDELAERAQEAFAAQQDKKVMKKLKIREFLPTPQKNWGASNERLGSF
jgi:hypothetical protein